MRGGGQCARAAAQFEQAQESLGESRSGGLLGAYKEVSGEDKEVLEAARFAAEQLSARSNSLAPFELKQARRRLPVLPFRPPRMLTAAMQCWHCAWRIVHCMPAEVQKRQ
jgi:hypothetical protein